MAGLYALGDYVAAVRALLPRGRAWEGSVIGQVVQGLCGSAARLDARAQDLLVDAFPASSVELLPDWESSLGLPDPCAGIAPTIQQREAQVVARLTDSGGQSAQHFINFAAQLGYTISIRNYAPSRFGRPFGQPFGGEAWAHTWAVIAPLETVTRFAFGQSGFGEPFAAWSNAVLECELQARAPAHTILLFIYESGVLDFTDPNNSDMLPGL